MKNMDNKSYNKQREIASLSYPPRSLNKRERRKNLVFMRVCGVRRSLLITI